MTNTYDNDELGQLLLKLEMSDSKSDLLSIISQIKSINSNLFTNKLISTISLNHNQIKSSIIENSETIIKTFSNLKDVKEELTKSKKGLETLSSQTLM
jgi:hypothetical protein